MEYTEKEKEVEGEVLKKFNFDTQKVLKFLGDLSETYREKKQKLGINVSDPVFSRFVRKYLEENIQDIHILKEWDKINEFFRKD